MSSQSKGTNMEKINTERNVKGKYTVANYFTSRKFLKSTKNSQLPQHLDATGISKHFHYPT